VGGLWSGKSGRERPGGPSQRVRISRYWARAAIGHVEVINGRAGGNKSVPRKRHFCVWKFTDLRSNAECDSAGWMVEDTTKGFVVRPPTNKTLWGGHAPANILWAHARARLHRFSSQKSMLTLLAASSLTCLGVRASTVLKSAVPRQPPPTPVVPRRGYPLPLLRVRCHDNAQWVCARFVSFTNSRSDLTGLTTITRKPRVMMIID